jgi:hypothetical protein
MKKISIVVILLLLSTFCFGQAPEAALHNSISDVYVGLVGTFPDYGPQWNSYNFKGGEIAYTRHLGAHWGVTTSGMVVHGNIFIYSATQYSGTAGVKYSFLTGRLRPYATAQTGYAHQSSTGGSIGSNAGNIGMYGNQHHPPLLPGSTDIEDGLTYRAGIGGDIQLTHRIYWRVAQWDVQRLPWGSSGSIYNNFSSGIGFGF